MKSPLLPLAMNSNRREFLQFMGRSVGAIALLSQMPACATGIRSRADLPLTAIVPSSEDALTLSPGLKYKVLLTWNQKLNQKGERFGYNNDFIAFVPLDSKGSEAILWVNHEYHDPITVGGWRPGQPRTLKQINKERKSVGGSLVHVKKTENGWSLVQNSKYNRRLDGFTKIPLISEEPIRGTRAAVGTLGNCAGGVTPWGTILTAEENYFNFVGDVEFKDGKREQVPGDTYLTWENFVKLPPEHYGWVVEVEPKSGKAKKLTALGRFSHECATTVLARDGRTVVYSADDADQEHLYKFISDKPGSLEKGELFVANLEQGRWLPLNWHSDNRLKSAFKSPTEMLVRTREAAKIVGATPLNRPEDVEIDPKTGDIFISLTNSKIKNDAFGSILRISENKSDYLSLDFSLATFVAGGPETGFACPDNLVFDKKGNLWMTTDMSGSVMHKPPFSEFKNNGLFFIALEGPSAGIPIQVASAPWGAELTGPCFSSDGRTLFLSVQHPGEKNPDLDNPRSHWPDGGNSQPRPSVVAISGPALDQLIQS